MNPEFLSLIINFLSSFIYDGMKYGATHILPDVKSKISESRVKEAVSKAVVSELENKISKSTILDCDAMQDYIEHMQPIQKIYQKVFCQEKYIEVSTEELLGTLQAETSEYLKDRGKNINPLEESEIKEFYRSILRICDAVSVSLLTSEDNALARLLSIESENSKKTIVSEISSQGNKIEQSLQKISGFLTNRNETYTMAMPKQTMLEVMPYKYIGGSEKDRYVKKLTSDLRNCHWVHIYGKMFTGKTQTLIRVAEHVASYMWITVKEEEFQNVSIKEIDLPEDTVVIIDGIPNVAKPGIKEKCIQILSECKEKKCKLITSGYEDAAVFTKGFVLPNELISIELNGFTEDEVEEIMRNHNAPEGLFRTKGYHNFVELCKGLPPVVMEVVHRMEMNGWKYDDEVFMTILTRRTESIEEQMKHLFLDAVEEEEARRLYYRILYANRAIEKKWLQPITAIPEKISNPDKNMEVLRNRWIYTDGQLYQCPNKILQNYAEEQLSLEEKKAINEFLVNEIKKHSLEPLDVSDLLLYYSRLEDFDAQGLLCYQIMEQMIENDVKEYPVSVEMFWQGMPLPKKMSPFIKVVVRAQQLFYRIWRGDVINDYEAKRKELWKLASDDECKLLVIVHGMKLALTDVAFSLDFFKDFLVLCDGVLNVPEFLQKDLPEILCEPSAFSAYNTTLGLQISELADLEHYIDIMEQGFIKERWSEIENIEDIDAIVLCMLDRVWNNMGDNSKQYMKAVQRLYSMLDKDETPILWKSVLHSYLLGYQKVHDYEGAKKLYVSVELILKANPIAYLEIVDEMARIAHDNNDYELEKQLFRWEMQVIRQDKKIVSNRVMMDSCLLYLDKLSAEERQEIENVHETMIYIANNMDLTEYPRLPERVEAEYWMKLYLIGALETEMSGFLLFVEKLLEEFQKHEDIAIKSILTKMCHVLGYISGKLLRNCAPDKFPDGSNYASPKLRMFLNDVKDTEVVSYWKTEKVELMYYICAALADKYDLHEIGNRAFQKMISNLEFWSKTLEYMYRAESYLQMKFLEQNEVSKLAYFMQKSYEPQERNQIEIDSEYFWVVREQTIFSIYILQVYHKSTASAMTLCEQLWELIDENQYSELGQRYYREYKKILRLVIEEEADFDLLKEAFFLIQKKPELVNMDSGVFPLLLLQAQASQKQELKSNVIRCLKNLRFENDFVMEKYIEMMKGI